MSALDTAGCGSQTPEGLSAAEVAAVREYARGRTPGRSARARVRWLSIRLGIPGTPAALVDYAYRHGYLAPEVPRRRPDLPPLLVRQLECLAQGLGTRATSGELGVARSTVRQYKRRLLDAMGVKTSERAVAIGWETGLLRTNTAPGPGGDR